MKMIDAPTLLTIIFVLVDDWYQELVVRHSQFGEIGKYRHRPRKPSICHIPNAQF